ncbi:hypothetical protein NQZ68_033010 [Dissostichus eleginoides]|nr:hypothetical protein NQZ68_033010 [Dissostichus eleginoides]
MRPVINYHCNLIEMLWKINSGVADANKSLLPKDTKLFCQRYDNSSCTSPEHTSETLSHSQRGFQHMRW